MFHRLRLLLTATYTLIAVAFVIMMIAITYGLLAYYFRSITDLALQHKMAHEFELLGLPLPPELSYADQEWNRIRHQLWPLARPRVNKLSIKQLQENWQQELAHLRFHLNDQSLEETYDSELSALFLVPLDTAGQVLLDSSVSGNFARSRFPHQQAVQVAATQGYDLRTVLLSDGVRVRLLTYHLPPLEGVAYLQLGRLLADQDFILQRFLTGLLGVGAVGALLSAGGSWWLAGRSLRPVQQSVERQRTFVANASHELRTPLTLIRASAEVAHNNLAQDGENRELLADIIFEVDHMTRLVDDLLLLSRLDAGRLGLTRRLIPLADLLEEAQRQSEHLAHERNVQVEVKGVEGVVLADPTRLHQILLIVLENALHNTPAGGVITLEAGEQADGAWITVADTGVGIPTEHLAHLFDRFYQVDPSRNGQGLGLGLSIAKALVEAHHGQIQIESLPGHGATVRIALPKGSQAALRPGAEG